MDFRLPVSAAPAYRSGGGGTLSRAGGIIRQNGGGARRGRMAVLIWRSGLQCHEAMPD